MLEITYDNIFWELIRNKINENQCDHSEYKGWCNETLSLKENLIKRGQFNLPTINRINEEYWGDGAPIVFSKHPYNQSEIHQCSKCKTLFFHHQKEGENEDQNRYRIINKNLIDRRDYQPQIHTIIDGKNYEFLIQKSPNGILLLSVSIPDIGVGIDVKYTLNNKETDSYYNKGISILENRMNDMRINHSNYRTTSWR